jgi:hypothetical protein
LIYTLINLNPLINALDIHNLTFVIGLAGDFAVDIGIVEYGFCLNNVDDRSVQ